MVSTPVHARSGPRVFIVVENLAPRRDRRVWREAQALRDAGYVPCLIGPTAPGDGWRSEVEGIELRTYPRPPALSGVSGFVVEYAYSFAAIATMLAVAGRERRPSAVQICNPPDIFFPIAAVCRRFGIPVVFDHHDLAPELFVTRFGNRLGLVRRFLELCERETFRRSDHVIATNESYREIARTRGGKPDDAVTVVRNGPDITHMTPVPPRPELKCGRAHLCVWFGNMGPQDGVDRALRAASWLVHTAGRDDVHFAFVGTGDALPAMRELASALGLDAHVTFTGWVDDATAFAYLSTADIGLSADPPGPLNSVSTMNKTMEYMAFGLPVVAFDLVETRRSAGEAALYAEEDDPVEYAQAIEKLLDDAGLRAELGRIGRRRVETQLAWQHQRAAYVGVYDRVVGRAGIESFESSRGLADG
ncbi:MAG TPA: glycosyltransferase family 4 protein [Acidimicrobiales bacterium]